MAWEPGVPLHHFTVRELHRMREAGVLAPGARVELLAGILVDKHRPSARELEATRRIVGILAERLDAPVVAGEPDHPDGYANFDATIMVHDWEHLAITEPWPLHRFSLAEFDRMLETGILSNADRVELLDGVVVEAPTPAPDGMLADIAQRLAVDTSDTVVRRRSAVELGPYSRLWIDIAICRPGTMACDAKRVTGRDVIHAVDIRSSPDLVQQLRWPQYARWGVKAASIVQPGQRGEVWIANLSGSH